MKTTTYLILSVAAVFLINSCTNSTNTSNDKNSGTATDVQSLNDSNHKAKEFKHVIPLDAMKAMVNTYETERVSLINNNEQLRKVNGENFVDSKSGWVSLDDLSTFVDEVKASAKNNRLDIKDMGVRLYFSVYPLQQTGESAYFKSLESEYRSKQTFLLLPTYLDSKTNVNTDILSTAVNNRSQEFFIGNPAATKGDNPAAREDGNANNSPSFIGSQGYIGLNHMALCPPACP